MFILLLAAAVVYLVLGDTREAVVLAVSILIVIVITVLQTRRTEHALARLRDLSSPRALVMRDGMEQRIAGREVVVGDVVLLREGDRVPADAMLQSATNLCLDESIITGESLPAEREARVAVYSGSLIVRGYGAAEVTAIGASTQIGKIGGALATLKDEITPLYREVRRAVRVVALVALLLCAVVALLYGWSRQDWLGGTLAGITLAMGVLPEEFPVVLTIFLAMGAWRISRRGVLTRRMPAIESIGAVTLLAVDKTGTLTENRMRVAVIEAIGPSSVADLRVEKATLNAAVQGILETALAASERQAFDPMENAIHVAAAERIPERARALTQGDLVREYDLTPELLAVTHAWRHDKSSVATIAVKGAPETVFGLCRVDPATRAALLDRVSAYARDGLRVLAVAAGEHSIDTLPNTPHGFQLKLVGLLCLADPIRPEVSSTLADCASAGIRVVMITGDHPGTGLAIAKQAGIEIAGGVLTGDELAAMSDEALAEHCRTVNVYARTKPEHKLRLVQAFKRNGEVVGMTGDGVNDAPALKAAHIGVAMGQRGTDVAREAASLVLVDDNFSSLIGAVRLGRRIYSNIRHAMGFIIAVHIPIAVMGLLPVLFGWPLFFYPMHVLFLEFVIDPACSLAFEADGEASDIMKRPPRAATDKLFGSELLMRSVFLGSIATILVAGVYFLALARLGEWQARTLAFIALVVSNVTLIFLHRASRRDFLSLLHTPNSIFWWIVALTFILLGTAVYVPGIAEIFKFLPPPIIETIAVALLAGISLLVAGWLFNSIDRQSARRIG